MNYTYFYAPRGYVIDFKKKELVRDMTKKIVEFVKSKKAIFIKIDPDIIIKEYNYLNEEVKLKNNHEEIFKTLKELG